MPKEVPEGTILSEVLKQKYILNEQMNAAFEKCNITVQKLENETGIDRVSIWRALRGETELLQVYRFIALCKGIKYDPGELFGFTKNAEPDQRLEAAHAETYAAQMRRNDDLMRENIGLQQDRNLWRLIALITTSVIVALSVLFFLLDYKIPTAGLIISGRFTISGIILLCSILLIVASLVVLVAFHYRRRK